MTFVFALLGIKALWLTYIWLASTIAASWLSGRKGYGEKPGLATGLLLSAVGLLIWLLVPPRADSAWKRYGALGRKQAKAASAAPPPGELPTDVS